MMVSLRDYEAMLRYYIEYIYIFTISYHIVKRDICKNE